LRIVERKPGMLHGFLDHDLNTVDTEG
jgi:hypothetical protein